MSATDSGDTRARFEGDPAQSWEQIESGYRELAEMENMPFDLRPMAELARRVRLSGIDRSLGGIVRLRTLRCMMHKKIYSLEPSLLIDPNTDGSFTFTYVFSSGSWPKDDWTATYPAEQLMPAFSRFLKRVGWVPEGHPAHAILVGDRA
ncbi:hypothetical protein [Terricaulis sp.]|uniref:hypothetical protein n=1 Tax=Terricaulis sp. TaxID=2768686 RepID=UPI00378362A0